MTLIRLPANNWRPRDYQLPAWTYLEDGGLRAHLLWHRRSGKDEICGHWTACASMQRPGNYWHMLPTKVQAAKVVWNAVNPHTGQRRIDEWFPRDLRARTDSSEMLLELKGGSAWQLCGSDNYNALVGAPPVGVVFSEWALSNPAAWAYVRPILRENGGWAIFITTVRGRNHAVRMYQAACRDEAQFGQVLTAEETGVFTPAQLAQERAEYIAEFGRDDGAAIFNQEYLCDFDAAILGSYFGPYMSAAQKAGRIRAVPWQPDVPVITAWDLGTMAIWFVQLVGFEIRVIDYITGSGGGLEKYVKEMREKPYVYGQAILPHDVMVEDLGSGRTRLETLQSLGVRDIIVLPQEKSVEDGINAARTILPRCYFDEVNCADGLDALRNYRRQYDEKLRTFKRVPLKDWASHGCFTADTEVLTRYGMRQISNLPQSGEVLTPCGWKRYISPRRTRKNAQLVAVTFDDGLTVRCTPDHMFLTTSGWKSAGNLQPDTLIQSSLTQSRNISMAGFTAVIPVIGTIRAAGKIFTAQFGSWHLDQSQEDVTSITGTATRAITRSPTLSAWMPLNIFPRAGTVALTSTRWGQRIMLWWRQPLGIALRPGGFGTVAMRADQRVGPNGGESPSSASRAAKRLWRWFEKVAIRKNTATQTVRPLRVARVVPLCEREDVWDLTVPDGRCFSLANGAVVHNSDAFRYLARGLPDITDYGDEAYDPRWDDEPNQVSGY